MKLKIEPVWTYFDIIDNESESEDYDQVLRASGNFGRYQILTYFLIGLAIVFSAATSTEHIYATRKSPHRCFLPECGDVQNSANNFDPDWLGDKIPLRDGTTPEGCYTFKHLYGENDTRCFFTVDYFSPFVPCHQWVFNQTDKSIQNTFKIFCTEDEWKLEYVNSAKYVAPIVSFILLGVLIDSYGRQKVLAFALITVRVVAMLKSVMPSYESYLAFEIMESVANGGIYNIALIMACEFPSSNLRYLFGVGFAPLLKHIGFLMVTFVAMGLRNWQHTCWAINSPIAMVFVVYIWLLPESVRWLIVRGRLGDAKDQIFRLIGHNFLHVHQRLLRKIINWYNGCVDKCEEDFSEEPLNKTIYAALLSKQLVLRFFLCLIFSFMLQFVSFGLREHPPILPNFIDDYWRNVILWLMDVPGFFLAVLLNYYLSQPKSMGVMLFFCAFCNIANIFIPRANRGDYIYYTKLPLYIISRATISGAFATLHLTILELFPTKIRGTVFGFVTAFEQLSMLAPHLLSDFNKNHELDISLGIVAFVAAVAVVVFLPDTTEKPLPMTYVEAEEIGKWKRIPFDPAEYFKEHQDKSEVITWDEFTGSLSASAHQADEQSSMPAQTSEPRNEMRTLFELQLESFARNFSLNFRENYSNDDSEI
ncbi:Hypothetical predicted protein [Cloeon dipterum]|uniref:Major facilitator superfamily (MFS) profile domain-containing protein n=1 Tax=Cloeon dipterum TaxID=197152 RepID=A0A8S1CBX5_9INSE|nr:Hypothetical predicted protein [Cloeon dipterum]